MDFGAVLHKAQRNEKNNRNEGVRYYSTKFSPPKKEQRNKQQLSENVKKFLAKKEEEEKRKKLEAQRKKEALLALRAQDKKATRRVNVMLKRTKSANQSVLDDAVDHNNTSVTLAGLVQPDEDDYGYVSQEASAYYNKIMEKYSKMPDSPKFTLDNKKKVSTNLDSTKDRVKAALEREKEEANMPHRRKRKRKEEHEESDQPVSEPSSPSEEPKYKPKPKPKAAPPSLNFNDLLKLAEKKQFEPIVIKEKPKEEERPLTKKQKKEMEREKEWKDRKEGKLPPLEVTSFDKNKKLNSINKSTTSNGDVKIPKLNGDMSKKATEPSRDDNRKLNVNSIKVGDVNKKNTFEHRKPGFGDKKYDNVPSKQMPSTSKSGATVKYKDQIDLKRKELGKPREFPPKDLQPKRFPPSDLKPKQYPPKDLKPKQFPPADVRRKEFPPRDLKQKPVVSKRRILDEDDEYDSEMDDFIDDGPEDVEPEYLDEIRKMFRYDKSKYQYDDEDDVDNMESSFVQQMKEEAHSRKIGIMEDLEDMKMEEEEKRRKAFLKKKGKL